MGSAPGCSFVGYFFFEVPSNILLERVRRAALDRPHHDQLGHRLGRVRLHPADVGSERHLERMDLLLPAPAARRLRGRLLPRHHLLSDALVPDDLPRARHQPVHARDPDIEHHRGADLGPAAQSVRRRPDRMAVAVHLRGAAVGAGRVRGPGLPARLPAPGDLASSPTRSSGFRTPSNSSGSERNPWSTSR